MKVLFMFMAFFLFIYSCESGKNGKDKTTNTEINKKIENNIEKKVEKAPVIKIKEEVIEKYEGDFDKIKEKKVLRVLVLKDLEYESLPKKISLIQEEFNYLKKFANINDLKFKFIFKKNFKDLIPALISGEGDIIAANLTVTEKRKEDICFTNSLTSIDEVIVSRKGDSIKKISELKNRVIWIKKTSSYYDSLSKILEKEKDLKVSFAPEDISEDTILDRVASNKYDLTILDDNKLEEILLNRSDLQKNIEIKKHSSISWAIRKDSPLLKKELNKFINLEHIDLRIPRLYTDDFDEILKRGYIRVLTRNNSMTYFLYRGKILGFEYELVKYFAESYNLRVEFIIPPSRDKLIPWLLEGKGDIIAASMTTDAIKNDKISYSNRYDTITEDVVVGSDSEIKTKDDLRGKVFHVRKDSSYFNILKEHQKELGYEVKLVNEDIETEEIIENIELGKYELTLADSSIVNREISMGTKIKKLFSLKEGDTYSWIVRKDNTKLLAEINGFFKKHYKGLKFNIIYNKYFKNIRRIKKLNKFKASKTGKISIYDDIFKKYSNKYSFNWLMIASQAYQESRFNPKAKSWVGAIGLMQVMPKTGKMLGFTNLYNPNSGVHAGVKYMYWLEKRFDPDIPAKDKMWFALASYNAGYGHVLDARRIAVVMGLNPNKWFNNVAVAMTKLSKKKYRKYTKYGYCKCKEPIPYVSQIKTRYEAYQDFLEK